MGPRDDGVVEDGRRRSRRARALVVAIGLAGLLAPLGCAPGDPPGGGPGSAGGGTTSSTTTVPYPGATWATTTPAAAGLAPAPLEHMAEVAGNSASDCVVVVRDGRIVAEHTWNGVGADQPQEIFSASKSFTSTLVGIAQAQGKLRIDEPASRYITEWRGTPSEGVTIRQLLSNDSGRHYDFVTDYRTMALEAQDKSAFAIGLDQQYSPGTHWDYNNSAIQTLETVLERATGEDMEAFARANLFEPIGMKATIARDNAGNPLAFMGVRASCRDLARFGHLFLNRGVWDGREVVPPDWVDEATHTSQDLNRGYGYLWWLFGTRGARDPSSDRSGQAMGSPPPASDAPTTSTPQVDAYAALGLGGQIVLVVPEDRLVIVRTGKPGGREANERALLATLFADGHRAADGG